MKKGLLLVALIIATTVTTTTTTTTTTRPIRPSPEPLCAPSRFDPFRPDCPVES